MFAEKKRDKVGLYMDPPLMTMVRVRGQEKPDPGAGVARNPLPDARGIPERRAYAYERHGMTLRSSASASSEAPKRPVSCAGASGPVAAKRHNSQTSGVCGGGSPPNSTGNASASSEGRFVGSSLATPGCCSSPPRRLVVPGGEIREEVGSE